jgi:uncharacterized protein (TIGR02145 family)
MESRGHFLSRHLLKTITMGTSKIYLLFFCLALIFISCGKSESDDPESSISYNGKSTAVFNPNLTYGTMTDIDGNEYKTIQIGTQTWMAENLRTTKYNDGTAIDYVTDSAEWIVIGTGAYCTSYHTTDPVYIATYGMLYNWFAVNTGKLAPSGWHVPTREEWQTLKTYLGGDNLAGGKMKETGMTHWETYNEGADNSSGFTALPSKSREGYSGSFNTQFHSGYFWTASGVNIFRAHQCNVGYNTSLAYTGDASTHSGLVIRCVKD